MKRFVERPWILWSVAGVVAIGAGVGLTAVAHSAGWNLAAAFAHTPSPAKAAAAMPSKSSQSGGQNRHPVASSPNYSYPTIRLVAGQSITTVGHSWQTQPAQHGIYVPAQFVAIHAPGTRRLTLVEDPGSIRATGSFVLPALSADVLGTTATVSLVPRSATPASGWAYASPADVGYGQYRITSGTGPSALLSVPFPATTPALAPRLASQHAILWLPIPSSAATVSAAQPVIRVMSGKSSALSTHAVLGPGQKSAVWLVLPAAPSKPIGVVFTFAQDGDHDGEHAKITRYAQELLGVCVSPGLQAFTPSLPQKY